MERLFRCCDHSERLAYVAPVSSCPSDPSMASGDEEDDGLEWEEDSQKLK